MDVKDFISGGTFLRADDVKSNPGAECVIQDAGEEQENSFGRMQVFMPVSFNGKDYTFALNKTNAKKISEDINSTDTTTWIGRSLELETYKTRTSKGDMVDAIIVIKVKPLVKKV